MLFGGSFQPTKTEMILRGYSMKRCVYGLMALMLIVLLCACQPGLAEEAVAQPDKTVAAPETTPAATTPEPTPAAKTEPPVPDGMVKTSLLLMGAMDHDFSGDGNPYAMTHILVSLDPANQSMGVVTFPYNLAVDVETKTGTEKLQRKSGASASGRIDAAGLL
jgi:hypothetical protein